MQRVKQLAVGTVVGLLSAACSATAPTMRSGQAAGPVVPPSSPPHARLFMRSAGGVETRVWLWHPDAANSAVELELSNEGAVALANAIVYPEADGGRTLTVINSSTFGVKEGYPATWLAVRAPVGSARVQVRFDDGITDEMEPQEGWAVLMRNGVGHDGVVEAVRRDGSVAESTTARFPVPCEAPIDSVPTCANWAPGSRLMSIRTAGTSVIRLYMQDPALQHVIAELSTPDAVIAVEGLGYAGPAFQLVAAQQSGLDGRPPAVIITHGASDATSVRARFDDGTTDEMSPINGWAVLIANAPRVNATVTESGRTGLPPVKVTVTGNYPPSA